MVGNLCSHYALLALVFPGDTFEVKQRDVKKSLKPEMKVAMQMSM